MTGIARTTRAKSEIHHPVITYTRMDCLQGSSAAYTQLFYESKYCTGEKAFHHLYAKCIICHVINSGQIKRAVGISENFKSIQIEASVRCIGHVCIGCVIFTTLRSFYLVSWSTPDLSCSKAVLKGCCDHGF